MNTRFIIAVSVTLYLRTAISLLAYDRGWPPGAEVQFQGQSQQLSSLNRRPAQTATQTVEASNADISAGLKKYIDSYARKSADRKFHVRYRGKDLPLNLIKVHDDRLSAFAEGKYFACVD